MNLRFSLGRFSAGLLASPTGFLFAEHMDKGPLREAIIERLREEFERQARAALMARDEATHEESKAENQYDMHSQEAAYLAEGQARLATELNDSINVYRGMELPHFTGGPAGIGAIVTLEARGVSTTYFVGPRNGGLEVPWGETTIVVVTPQSPLGRLLIGQRVGDVVQLPGRGASLPHRIAAVE